MWKSSLQALAVTLTRFFVEPFEHIGEAVRKLLMSLLEGVPFYLYPLMIVFLIVILLLPLLVFRNYCIRSWFLNIEPSHTPDNSEARALQKKLELQKVKTRELKVTISMDIFGLMIEGNEVEVVERSEVLDLWRENISTS